VCETAERAKPARPLCGAAESAPKLAEVSGWHDWIRTVEVEPSLYAADFSRLGEQIETLLHAGVRIFHFDVGDGHFVEPITFGPIVLQWIAPIIHEGGAFVDCHLMTEQPEKHFAAIAKAGGDSVTVHYEACPDLSAVVGEARAQNLRVGLAFKPETSAAYAAHAALSSRVDIVLVMSIEPGYSGQEFMPEALDRIRTVRSVLPHQVHVQVDGGIGSENARAAYEAGATLLVAGTSIFGREDLTRAYRRLVQELT
jgi:ribulose-phosphate 3-epimerase